MLVGVMVVDAVTTVDVVDDAGVEVVVTPDTFVYFIQTHFYTIKGQVLNTRSGQVLNARSKRDELLGGK